MFDLTLFVKIVHENGINHRVIKMKVNMNKENENSFLKGLIT